MNLEKFKKLTQEEQNIELFNRQQSIINKIEKIEAIGEKFDDIYAKLKPFADKIPTEAIKNKAKNLMSKFSKKEKPAE